jgi:hypothetical protein
MMRFSHGKSGDICGKRRLWPQCELPLIIRPKVCISLHKVKATKGEDDSNKGRDAFVQTSHKTALIQPLPELLQLPGSHQRYFTSDAFSATITKFQAPNPQ